MRQTLSVALSAFALLLASNASLSAQVVILRADRWLDVETGRLVQPAVVVIEQDRIRAINPPTVPEGRTIDLKGMTLLPGLIDAHTHLTHDLEGDWPHHAVTETEADLALRGARNARRTIMAGFTTIREVGAHDFVDVRLMHAIDAGWIEGPRIIPSGAPIGITGGHCDATGFAPGVVERGVESGIADGADGVLQAVRYQIKHGARWVKICATAGVLSFEGQAGARQMSDLEIQTAVDEAARHGLKVAAHAHGTEGIIAAARAGVASIEHGSLLTDEAIQILKDRGTYLVPTAYLSDVVNPANLPPVMRAKAEFVIPRAKEGLGKAIRAGVKIAFGTDAGVFPHGQNAKEFSTLVSRGMTPIEAIRTATVNATDLLGLTDRGRIAVGRLADVIAVSGNPLEDVHTLEEVRFVMKGGTVYRTP